MPLLDFPVFGWIRDLLGIRKDIIDTKKSKLEVRKLQDEELDRNLITRATLADIEKYDPKYGKIKAAAMSGNENLIENNTDQNIRKHHWLVRFFGTLIGIVALFGLIFALYNFILRIYKSLFK